MSLYLLPHRGASLSTWSFGDGTPRFDLSGEYFIFYSHGLDVHSWTFWFEIQVFFFKKTQVFLHNPAILESPRPLKSPQNACLSSPASQ